MSASPTAEDNDLVIIKINVPSIKVQKAFRVNSNDTIWSIGRLVTEKVMQDIKDVFNYGLYLHGYNGKKGKFLDDRNTVGSYHLDGTCQIDFTLKCKVGADPTDAKKQKKIMEDVRNGNLDQLKEKSLKAQKQPEVNFVFETGETPMSVATMNNDADMIVWLMDNGAFLDFRSGEKDQWKTPLHMAALHNKPHALKTLIQYGAWVDAKDAVGLTPLYYAAGAGNSECVLRLLLAKANTEIVDVHGRNAAMNNYDCIVALLIDFGANMDQVNVGGNTPLHVAASRGCKESTKWLLLRGADTTKLNKSGKRPYDCALQAACIDICEIMEKFTPENIIIPPQKYIPESPSEYDGIVANVLAGLSSSIGKEYTPLLYYTKPLATAGDRSSRGKSLMPSRKSMMPQFGLSSEEPMRPSSSSPLSNTKMTPNSMPQSYVPGSTTSNRSSVRDSFIGADEVKNYDSFIKANVSFSTADSSPVSSIVPPQKPAKTQSVNFDIAWRKIEPQKDSKVISNIKTYFADKITASSKDEGAILTTMLSEIETFESGFVKAAEEVDSLRRKNELLVQKLKDLGVSM